MQNVTHLESGFNPPGGATVALPALVHADRPGALKHLHCTLGLLVGLTLTTGIGVAQTQQLDLNKPVHPAGGPPVKFAILADPHLYEKRLGTSGPAFEAYLAQDPKLLALSEAILDSAFRSILAQRVKFVIIVGDLTKDGEIQSHVLMANRLAWLEQRGVQVFVVPGNHDMNNPDARSFHGDTTRPVPSASVRSFKAIYHRFGYGQALDHAPDSLSYVAEPVRGLWLLALDSTDTAANQTLGHPRVGGRLTPATLDWALAKIQQARSRGKWVIPFMHHGVNPNFLAEPQFFGEYLVDDWPLIGATLAAANIKVIFTGHYHAQDAAWPLDANYQPIPGSLLDVATASLCGWPCAYRIATLTAGGELSIRSQRVTEISAPTGGLPFQDYAAAFLAARLPALATAQLMAAFQLSQEQAAQLAPLVVGALMAQYAGDEVTPPDVAALIATWMGSPDPLEQTLGMALYALWTDLPPADNEVNLSLATP